MATDSHDYIFLDRVRQCGAADAEELAQFLAEPGLPLRAPAELVDLLVLRGLLTRYQAESLLRGSRTHFILSGKYRLLTLLAHGGSGEVFVAEHLQIKRHVVVKMLDTLVLDHPVARERFRREGIAYAALEHPHIVRLYEVDEEYGRPYLIMEYLKGINLHDLVQRQGPLPVEQAVDYIAQVAQGLQFAHQLGWIHRDIKPNNLVVGPTGHVKILDFGLARLVNEASSATRILGERAIIGTADYMSPEQAASAQTDCRSDLYSLGCTLYFLLTAHPPFPEGNAMQKVLWHRVAQPTPLGLIREGLPGELVQIVERLMAKSPLDRFASCQALIDSLRPWLPSTNVPPFLPDDGDSLQHAPRTMPMARISSLALRSNPTDEVATKPSPRVTRWGFAIAFMGLTALIAGALAVSQWQSQKGQMPPALAESKSVPTPTAGKEMPVVHPPRLLAEKTYHLSAIEELVFTPDGRYLLSSGKDGRIAIWDAPRLELIGSFEGHIGIVRSIAVASDSRFMVSCGAEDGTVRVWDIASTEQIEHLEVAQQKAFSAVALSSDDQLLIAGGIAPVLGIWERNNHNQYSLLNVPAGSMALAFRPGRKEWIIALMSNGLEHIDFTNKRFIASLNLSSMPWQISIHPEGTFAVAPSLDGIRVCNLIDHTFHDISFGNNCPTSTMVYLPDGKQSVVASNDGCLRLVDMETKQVLTTWSAHDQQPLCVAVSPDGRFLFSGGRDNRIMMWDLHEMRKAKAAPHQHK